MTPPAEANGSRNLEMLAALLVLAGVPLLYWMFTGQIWEDFLITFRSSHNLVMGNGLTYEKGTRIFSFTSPINALLPAAFDYLTRTDGYVVPLALYNVVAIACFAAGGILLLRLIRADKPSPPYLALLFPVLLVLCARTTAFVVNGQEAGFWVLFLALGFAATVRGIGRHWLAAGLGWSGLMWTRPDSPVYISLFALIALILPLQPRWREFRGICKAALVCTAGYLPWFLWAWVYYGSPVPNSAKAKFHAYIGELVWLQPSVARRFFDSVGGAFAGIYETSITGWMCGALALGLLAACAWLIPGVSRLTRCASAAYLGSVAYLGATWSMGTAFPWYFVPACLFAAMTCALLALEGANRLIGGARLIPYGFAVLSVLLVGQFFVPSLPRWAAQQELVEHDIRKPLGLWLKAHMKAGETVYLEPCGYIGYYSDAAVRDYPGLTSPQVVALRKGGEDFYGVIEKLKPGWLVLRVNELIAFFRFPELVRDYRLALEVENTKKISQRGWDGYGFDYDSHLFVLRRIRP